MLGLRSVEVRPGLVWNLAEQAPRWRDDIRRMSPIGTPRPKERASVREKAPALSRQRGQVGPPHCCGAWWRRGWGAA